MKFILDANFLMIPGQFKVDVFEQLERFGRPEIYTLNLVVAEIENLSKKKTKNSRFARLAMEILSKANVEIIVVRKKIHTDEAIIELAKKGFVVCTQDKQLIQKLRRKKCKIISLRQNRYLQHI